MVIELCPAGTVPVGLLQWSAQPVKMFAYSTAADPYSPDFMLAIASSYTPVTSKYRFDIAFVRTSSDGPLARTAADGDGVVVADGGGADGPCPVARSGVDSTAPLPSILRKSRRLKPFARNSVLSASRCDDGRLSNTCRIPDSSTVAELTCRKFAISASSDAAERVRAWPIFTSALADFCLSAFAITLLSRGSRIRPRQIDPQPCVPALAGSIGFQTGRTLNRRLSHHTAATVSPPRTTTARLARLVNTCEGNIIVHYRTLGDAIFRKSLLWNVYRNSGESTRLRIGSVFSVSGNSTSGLDRQIPANGNATDLKSSCHVPKTIINLY